MQAKRLLDDREVFVGDGLLDAQRHSYGFLVHSGGELVVTTEGGRSARFHDYWEKQGMSWVPGAKTDLGYWGGYRKENRIKYYFN